MHIYRLNPSEFRAWRGSATRDQLKQRIYKSHGVTQLRAPSGRILGTARAPEGSGRVPVEKTIAKGAHHAVSPGECICREWQKPADKQHEHHPICMHKTHWETQQARSPDALRERSLRGAGATPGASTEPSAETDATVDTERRPDASRPPTAHAAPAVPVPATAPDDCACKDWSGTPSGHHHSLCQARERWEREHNQQPAQLIELETGTVTREASPEEVEASKQKATEDGVGAIELSDGKLYYVRAP